mgnify:CR=1 FL=1
MGLLLERPQAVDAALALRRMRADLEPELAVLTGLVDRLERLAAEVLHTVAHALHEVRDEARDRALVDDGARDALGNLDALRLAEVARVGALEHGVDRAHAAVLLETDAVLEMDEWKQRR